MRDDIVRDVFTYVSVESSRKIVNTIDLATKSLSQSIDVILKPKFLTQKFIN